jgi:hypothetical protein
MTDEKFVPRLSVHATKLFGAISRLAELWDTRTMKVRDLEIASRSNITLQHLLPAQVELERAGLLTISRLDRKAKYILPHPTAVSTTS